MRYTDKLLALLIIHLAPSLIFRNLKNIIPSNAVPSHFFPLKALEMITSVRHTS